MERQQVIDPYQKNCKFDRCTKPFKANRLNQDYCTGDCKKKSNNAKASSERMITKVIDDSIKRNRKILEQLFEAGKTTLEWSEIISKGFDYTKHTGRCADKNDNYTIAQFHNYTLEKINEKQFKIDKLW